MDGSIGRQAERAQDFMSLLSEHIHLPVEPWDERLSTKAAERLMLDAGSKRSQRKEWRDALAAALILQGYLDRAQAIE
jgi:putative Holliday junction resolvase